MHSAQTENVIYLEENTILRWRSWGECDMKNMRNMDIFRCKNKA